jgi:hypothetical protein
MAASALPEEVAGHLQAAIQLSKWLVYMRLLDEAAQAAAQNLPLPAVVIAGAVLESALEAVPAEQQLEYRDQIERWRTLRNGAVHSGSPKPTLDQAAQMVEWMRDLLTEVAHAGDPFQREKVTARSPDQVRGKYKYVPTSSAAFIERKADELNLEH